MNKKIIIPALIAVTLTACGGGNTQNNGGSDNSHTATQTTAQTTEAAKPAALKPKYVIADRLGGKFIFEDENIPSNAKRKVPAQTPDSLKNFKYIINDGKYYPVKLVGYQVGSEEGDNGRDIGSMKWSRVDCSKSLRMSTMRVGLIHSWWMRLSKIL